MVFQNTSCIKGILGQQLIRMAKKNGRTPNLLYHIQQRNRQGRQTNYLQWSSQLHSLVGKQKPCTTSRNPHAIRRNTASNNSTAYLEPCKGSPNASTELATDPPVPGSRKHL